MEITPTTRLSESQTLTTSFKTETDSDFLPTSKSLEAGYYAQENSLSVTGNLTSFSLTGHTTQELNGHLISLQFDVQITTLSLGVQHDSDNIASSLLDILPEDVRQEVEKYLGSSESQGIYLPEALSPENVSQNIVDFALSGYSLLLGSSPDTVESRQQYVDYIAPAIEQGINEALEILDPFLTNEVRDLVQETSDLIDEKLNQFIGIDLEA